MQVLGFTKGLCEMSVNGVVGNVSGSLGVVYVADLERAGNVKDGIGTTR